jgi:polyferredoxin
LVLALGLIMVLLSATRVGLITRWQRGLGIATAIVILPLFAGIFYLQLVPAAWMVSVGFLFLGRLPGGDPPAWAAGVACPWPSPAEVRAAKEGASATAVGAPAAAPAGADVAPAPSANGRSSRKRRRKRGARS